MAVSIISGDAAACLSAAPQVHLADLCTALGDFKQLASQVSSLKKDILEKEASVLKAILDRITALVPVLSRDFESYYRRELVILTESEEVKFEKTAEFYSELSWSFMKMASW